MRISIRAPARGATTVSVCAEFSGSNFNPRSREGSDIDWVSNPLCNAISIRTPARGATRTWTRLPRLCRFQSALPRGERRGDKSLRLCSCDISIRAPARGATSSHKRHVAGSRFQSALPRGERHNMVGYCQSHRDFNPRSREGSDDGTQLSVRYGCYFNPRSREGSDQSHKPRTAILQAFQSALPRGERRCTSSGISVAM